MAIRILINDGAIELPEGSIRTDIAWKLFLPECEGDLPTLGGDRVEPLRHWLWWELSRKLGFLHKHPVDPVYVIAPEMTESASDFLVRTCSLWADEVYMVKEENQSLKETDGGNLWTAPLVNVRRLGSYSPAMGGLSEKDDGGTRTLLSPFLGATKSCIQVYTIAKGKTSARFHSHSAREEFYMVLEGKGTIRIGGHSVKVSDGDLISKPIGPDIPTQFLADGGMELKILDVEIWENDERRAKDVIHYADHRELDLSGDGWDFIIPSDAVMESSDAIDHYDEGYVRKIDGSWEPLDMKGFRTRRDGVETSDA